MARQVIKLGGLIKDIWSKVNGNFEELYNYASQITNKVDKEAGKGLSENDYTTTEKEKLSGIAAGAQVNVIESVKVDGTALPITEKTVNIDLSEYAKKSEIASAYNYKGSVATVDDLPTTGNTVGDVWNVGTDSDGMNYAWTGEAWDALGASVDLSGYATTEQLNTGLSGKVDNVEGKGLSTNDYTNEEKQKVAAATAAAPTKYTFTNAAWGEAVDGYYSQTIAASGKTPVKVMRENGESYDEVIVQATVSGTNIILESEEMFAGYVLAV